MQGLCHSVGHSTRVVAVIMSCNQSPSPLSLRVFFCLRLYDVDTDVETAVSDVSEHAELDLDVADMETGADELTDEGFAAAYLIYSEGEHRCAELYGSPQGMEEDAQVVVPGSLFRVVGICVTLCMCADVSKRHDSSS